MDHLKNVHDDYVLGLCSRVCTLHLSLRVPPRVFFGPGRNVFRPGDTGAIGRMAVHGKKNKGSRLTFDLKGTVGGPT